MSASAATSPSQPSSTATVVRKAVVFSALAALTAAICFLFKPPTVVTESGVTMHWPDRVFDYAGKDEAPSKAELDILPADTEFAKKIYTSASGDMILAQIVLSGVEHRSIHRPEKCLEGQGWHVRSGQEVRVPLKSGRDLKVMVLDITRSARTSTGTIIQIPALYAYFFVSEDAETARHLERLAITNLDLLLHNKAHRWAYVIAMANVTEGLMPNGRNREQTLEFIENFIRETAPTFLKGEAATIASSQTNDSARK